MSHQDLTNAMAAHRSTTTTSPSPSHPTHPSTSHQTTSTCRTYTLIGTMPIPTLRIGLAGLGRMGKRHAHHFLHKIPRSSLVAISTSDPEEREYARHHYGPYGVTVYEEFADMLRHDGLQAVVISSATGVHASQARMALEFGGGDGGGIGGKGEGGKGKGGLHVLCGKPLSTDAEVSQTVVDAANKRPHLKAMCGFSRRFDASYRDAYAKMEKGLIGRPSIFRSQTCDKLDTTGSFIKYAAHSGGIFVDCSIHDIDLALWFFNSGSPTSPSSSHSPPSRSKVKSVSAVGLTAIAPTLSRYKDADNAVGIVEFWDDRIAYFYASRMMAAGQEDVTEIIGTRGKLTVNASPRRNLVEIHEGAFSSGSNATISAGGGGSSGGGDAEGPTGAGWREGGIRREVPADYFERFEQAFQREGQEWVEACLDDKPVPVRLEDAVSAVEVAGALQESLRTGRKVWFAKDGKRSEEKMVGGMERGERARL